MVMFAVASNVLIRKEKQWVGIDSQGPAIVHCRGGKRGAKNKARIMPQN